MQLIKHTKAQHRDVERAITGTGNYRLAMGYQQCYVAPKTYTIKTKEEKSKILQNILCSNLVCSIF